MEFNSDYVVQCTVCGLKFHGMDSDNICPYCGWWNLSDADKEDEYNCLNTMTQKTARERYKKGLNIWGEPLPKVRPKDEEGELFVPESSCDKK